MLIARLFGTHSVADLVKALEGDEEEAYDAQDASPEVAAIAADEREHAEIWDRLATGMPLAPDGVGAVDRDGVTDARRAKSIADIGRRETWHRRSSRSGTLRAVIFGPDCGWWLTHYEEFGRELERTGRRLVSDGRFDGFLLD